MSRESPPKPAEFIVGIGASAGGLNAIESFFSTVPPDPGFSIVLIQHLSPDFKSLMGELLGRHTTMEIHEAEDGMEVFENCIYLNPPRKNLTLLGGRLRISDQSSDESVHLPIDLFFKSLASEMGERSAAVVLSGTGTDGSRGVVEVDRRGGLVLVQDDQSAGFNGMPRSTILSGASHVVCHPATMAEKLRLFADDPKAFPRQVVDDSELATSSDLGQLLALVRSRYGVDFTQYRIGTLQRRVERRLSLMQAKSVSEYIERIAHDNEALDQLYCDLLIDVTRFFRDPRAFDSLRMQILPSLLAYQSHEDQVRVWVPGCATGQEAYSIAMLLEHALAADPEQRTFKVFATDVHHESLSTAAEGVYPQEAMGDVPEPFRDRFLTEEGKYCRIKRELRQRVVFARHDLTKDPPFTRIDLISCRNVLIYFQPECQERILSMFHFGLRKNGVLMLGPSESLGKLASEFESLETNWRIFRKTRDVLLPDSRPSVLPARPQLVKVSGRNLTAQSSKDVASVQYIMERLLQEHVPPSVLVDEELKIIHSFGTVVKHLRHEAGEWSRDLVRMLRGELRLAITTAVQRCKNDGEIVAIQNIRAEENTDRPPLSIIVKPYAQDSKRMFLISIKEQIDAPPPLPAVEDFDPNSQAAHRIAELERELAITKRSLESTVEELASSNEELQSTNEEMVTSNEELQSTNEELHSLNEELHTVNAEHQHKIDELMDLTDDMDNLLQSTGFCTIFLDEEHRIRRFTETSGVIRLIPQDYGRPIDDLAHKLDMEPFGDLVQSVIESGVPRESIVRHLEEDSQFALTVNPYRDGKGVVRGAVVTFYDIAPLLKALEMAKS